MSWYPKYNLTFKDFLGTQWDIDFCVDAVGPVAITDLVGTGDPVRINYEVSEYFTHDPIKASSVEINLIETIDDTFMEFFTADKVSKVKIYKGINLFWQGFTIASEYHSSYNTPPKSVTIMAVDGLTFLKNIPLNVKSGYGITAPGRYSLKTFFKQAFDQIGVEALIRESFNIWDSRMNLSNSPLTETYLDTWRFYREGTGQSAGASYGEYDNPEIQPYDNLYNVLVSILTAYGARLYQKDGCWYMDHIRQLSGETITYRTYDSLFVAVGTVVETRPLSITSATGTPRLVPIEHSLYKELERPYSQFVQTVNLDLNSNLIRYTDIFDVNGYTGYKITDKYIEIDSILAKPTSHGLVYSCGMIDMSDSGIYTLKLGITGNHVGLFRVIVYLRRTSNGIAYTYNIGTKRWTTWDNTYGDAMYCIIRESDTDVSGNYINESFSETVDIIGTGSLLSGELFVLISPPYIPGITGAALRFDRSGLKMDYNNAHVSNKTYTLTSSSFLANKGQINTNVYSRFLYESYNVNSSGQGSVSYITDKNAGLIYPGLLYYYDGSNYLPAYQFKYGSDGTVSLLELILLEDIMSYYSILRSRCLGILLGVMDFGSVLDYDGKRYMISACIFDIKKAQHEVTILQISTTGSFMLNDDGTYVLDENGNKMSV